MTIRRFAASAAALFFLTVPDTVHAQQRDTALIRMQQEIEALTREIESLRLGEDVVVQADTSNYGLGPAASKIYRAKPGLSIGGYGEVLLQKHFEEEAAPSGSGVGGEEEEEAGASTVDALRFITYVGYKFTPKLLFNSEVEFEHASTEYGGSVSVEFAYIDYVPSRTLGVRAGMLLVPMGFINELHEPLVFLGTTRPLTEHAIIPTTWRENGVGIFGESRGWSYRAFVINGFDAIGGRFDEAEGFSASGFNGGRQSGSEALLEHPAVVARVDYNGASVPGFMIGGSAYFGNSAQTESVSANTSILEAHAQYRSRGLELRALFAGASVANVAQLNALHGFTGTESIGESLHGWYLQGGYDVLRSNATQQLIPYIRYEKINTQAAVPTGFASDRATDRTATTVGAMWKPIMNIGIKADYQMIKPKGSESAKQFNISLGYLF